MSVDISLLTKKKPLLNSISLKANELEFSKDINVDKLTCTKLICDDIEINNSGETQIDNAIITNSKINNTSIGTIFPARAIFNKFQLKTSGNLETSFLIDSDININTEEPEFSEWAWKSKDNLLSSIVPFKLDVYQRVFLELGRFVK